MVFRNFVAPIGLLVEYDFVALDRVNLRVINDDEGELPPRPDELNRLATVLRPVLGRECKRELRLGILRRRGRLDSFAGQCTPKRFP